MTLTIHLFNGLLIVTVNYIKAFFINYLIINPCDCTGPDSYPGRPGIVAVQNPTNQEFISLIYLSFNHTNLAKEPISTKTGIFWIIL